MERDSKKVAVEEKQSDMVPFTYERLKDENAPSDGKERVTEEWSVNHCRVLYLMSKYAQCATMINRKESWIRCPFSSNFAAADAAERAAAKGCQLSGQEAAA